MQAISVYLYPNKLDVFTNLPDEWLQERYRRVYNRNVKIFRGVDNRVDLQAKNSDQKKQDLTGYTLVFNLLARETQELLLQKDCVIVSEENGRYYVTLTEADLRTIEPGNYQYSIIKETRTDLGNQYTVTERTPLYIDSQYGVVSTIEIGSDITGEPLDSNKITVFGKHESFGEPFATYYVSSIIDAKPELSAPQTTHTFQFNFKSYTGSVVIQGSLSEGGNPQVWTDLTTFTTDADNTLYKNVVGKYNWFRIKHTPDTIANTGTVDSVLYR